MRSNLLTITKRICRGPVAIAGGMLLCIPFAAAQSPNGQQQQQPQTPSPTQQTTQPGMSPLDRETDAQQQQDTAQMMDKEFVQKAVQGNLAEVQMGQLALQKSNNDDVKQFAQKMVDDHTKLEDQMKQVAQQLKVKAPDSPSSKQKSAMKKLQALNGDDFDKAYIKEMVKDHEQDDKAFKEEAKNSPNPGMKQVVGQDEQVINHHLEMIQQIAQKNNVVASK